MNKPEVLCSETRLYNRQLCAWPQLPETQSGSQIYGAKAII